MATELVKRRLKQKARMLYPDNKQKQETFVEGVLELAQKKAGIKPKKPTIASIFNG